MHRFLGFYFVLILCFFSISFEEGLTPDTKKLYQNILSGKGLYTPYDKVTTLNASNFENIVFRKGSQEGWVIKFYNSWCGHCLRFSTIWKSFAWDISGWKDIVEVGAVDCSSKANNELCRECEVFYYPMVKLFTRERERNGEIVVQPSPADSIQLLRQRLIDLLRNNSYIDLNVYRGTLDSMLNDSADFILLVIESDESYRGAELVLDMSFVKNVRVRIICQDESQVMRSLPGTNTPRMMGSDRGSPPEEIPVNQWNREEIYEAAKEWLLPRGILLKDLEKREELRELVTDFGTVQQFLHFERVIKGKLAIRDLSDTVFQLDIENALRHTLAHEIPSKKTVEGQSLVALNNYLEALVSHFPFGEKGVRFLRDIKESVKTKTEISGEEFEKMVKLEEEKHYPVFLEPSGWVGCRGSRPNLRGFPCGLWLMFHSLTVNGAPKTGTSVLYAILGYVKHFFGCTDCSEHFQEMASTIESSVFGAEDSVLWLWEAHNAANKRLSGDPRTEDPRHPKVQFPPASLCPSCYSHNGTFSRPHVLLFLRSMFHNISYITLDQLETASSVTHPQPCYIPLYLFFFYLLRIAF